MKKFILGVFLLLSLGLPLRAQVRGGVNAVTLKNAMACGDTSGSANTITCSTFQGLTAYIAKETFFVSMANTTTGATTININGLGAKNVTKNGTTPIASGDLVVGGVYAMQYDGTEFVVIGSIGGSGSTTLGTITPQPATAGDVVCANSTPTWVDCVQGIVGRTVSITSDTIASTDRGTTIAYTSASSVAVTLNSAASIGNNMYATVNVQGVGTVTLTPTAGLINGASSLAVTEGQTCYVHSPDNVNYTADCSNGQVIYSTGLTFTPSAHGGTLTASGTPALTNTHVFVGNASNVATDVALSGDCTMANTGAITCTKSSGVAFGTAAFATIPVVNGVTCNGACNVGTLNDTNGNASLLTGTTASAVNQVTVTDAATGNAPVISATGTDAIISLGLAGKSTGQVYSLPSFLVGGATTASAQAEITSGGNQIFVNGGRITWSATGALTGSLDTGLSRDAAGIIDAGNGTGSNATAIIRTGNTVQLTSNFTTASTSLVTITGLSWTFPSTAHNYSFDCRGSYSQATADAADAFGVQAATTAPTNLMANMRVDTSLSNAGTNATLPTLTTTTATNIGTFTPTLFGSIGTVADILTFHIHGQLQQATGATTLNIMALTGNASDSLTIYAGTSCTLEP